MYAFIYNRTRVTMPGVYLRVLYCILSHLYFWGVDRFNACIHEKNPIYEKSNAGAQYNLNLDILQYKIFRTVLGIQIL